MVIWCVRRKLRALFGKHFTPKRTFKGKNMTFPANFEWSVFKKVPSASVLRIQWPSNKFSKLSRGPELHKEMILKSSGHHNQFLLSKTRDIGHFFTFFKKFLQIGPTDRKKWILLNRRSRLPKREKHFESSSQRKLCFSMTLQDRRHRRNQTGKPHDTPIHF